MFEVGFTEILLICGIALLVLGPERLPKLASDLGRWAGRARAMARQLRTQLEQEVQYDPLKETPRPAPTIHTPAPAATETAGKTSATVTAGTTAATATAAANPSAHDHPATESKAATDPAPEANPGAVAAAGGQDESKSA
ncbi:MAG: Sec-independent protein translocase protein TatB [Steroidobacteraceae bacterium]|nr:Sec-independent protein translocase protein TatB [Steroidobacteraceae bacterium]